MSLQSVDLDCLLPTAETELEHEMARRLRLKEAALKWIVDKYMPEAGSGCDSRGVDDFAVVAAAGMADVEIEPYVAGPHGEKPEVIVEYV